MQHNLISLFSCNKAVSKILSCCAVFVFVFVCSAPASTHALADPVMQPVYDTQFYQLPQTFNGLSGPQQDIFYFVLGNNLISYAGLSDYEIDNPYSDPDDLGDWIKKLGYDLYNDVIESFSIAGAPIISAYKYSKELFGNIIGAMNFAGAFNNSSWQDFYTDVQTNGLDLQLYPSMFGALNQYFAEFGGLYQWQFSEYDIDFYPFTFTWYNPVPIGEVDFSRGLAYILENNPNGYFSTRYNVNNAYGSPETSSRSARYGTLKNYSSGDGLLPSSLHLFVNLTSHTSYLVFDDGTRVSGNFIFGYNFSLRTSSGSPILTFSTSDDSSYLMYFNTYTFSSTDVDNITQLVQNCINHNYLSSIYARYTYEYDYSNLIADAYYGVSWSDKTLVSNVEDLNFGESDSNNYLSPSDQVLLDIKGLLQDLLEQNDLRAPVLDNMSNPDGTPVTVQQLQPVSVAVELPDSGVTVPPNLFTPLFGDPGQHNGYIWYLWSMTKPLVLYTKDFLNTLLFNGNGIAWIVYGVISVGLVGGLIVKFLL